MRRLLALLCIAIATFACQLSATHTWATGRSPSGERISLSPTGLDLSTQGSALRSCRFWPSGAGEAALCDAAPNAERAHAGLRAAYPLLSVALWCAIGALFLQVLAIPKSTALRAAPAWLVTALVAAAILCLMIYSRSAVPVLSATTLSFGGAGFWFAACAGTASLVSAILASGASSPSLQR